jgi:chromate transporter
MIIFVVLSTIKTILQTIRRYIFLKDVLILSLSAFGGPQAHIGMLFERMVNKRRYISEEELLELNALCQILPGPTSTQTIVALAYKLGGPIWAYLTLLVWMAPAVLIMTFGAILISFLDHSSLSATRYLEPIALGCLAFAAYNISAKAVTTKVGIALMVVSGVLAYFVRSPWFFPFLLIAGGIITSLKFRRQPLEEKKPLEIEWKNFILWIGVFLLSAVLGLIFDWMPIKLFQKFYRNGSLVFGGGQVLIPLLYTEFVEFKHYLSAQEFNIGYALVHIVPGPVFSISAYLGAFSMKSYGFVGQIMGGLVSGVAMFLPGTFLIFFIIRFWEQLKQFRVVKASLEGINAVNSGLVIAASITMYYGVPFSWTNNLIMIATFLLLTFTKIPSPFIILAGLIAGFVLI